MDDSKLEDIVAFLTDFQWIFKHSNTKFIEAGILDTLPKHWAESLLCLSHADFNNIPFGKIPASLERDLKDFLQRISDLAITVPTIIVEERHLKPIRGINPKKLQEISRLSRQIHEICQERGIAYLVDLGSGLGYLCQMLNERFGYKILGIECDEERVKTARKRQERFFPTSTGSVKFVKHFISISSWEFIADELQKAFHVDPATTPVALVAFTRVGDLTVTSPASRWKRMTEEEHKIHGKNMFQRAILDALTDEGQEVQRIKKCGERVTSSDDFVGAICGFEIRDSITGSIIPWSSEHRSKWESLCEKYPRGGELAECLTLLQTTIQELCENVILLDRKLAVEEASKGFSCCLVKILDADTSPRCIVLIATKA
uniref:Methyltransferase domain-containing protein n=1 Tax=Lutzomyia longipalpis TaxID=7200 RepID=A0A1B0CN85_LUTLO